jgi:hypothetical protein
MKTLYTGHANVGGHEVYSFIYAETLLQAEEYLTALLSCYLHQYHLPLQSDLPPIMIVSRPSGWIAPDGYTLPATSKQYALRYPTSNKSQVPSEVDPTDEDLALYPIPPTEDREKDSYHSSHQQ